MKGKIAIIGGGIVGSTAAYYLSRQGQDVTLYDMGTGQATTAAAGIICPWFSLRRNKPWYYLVSQGAEFYHQLMKDLQSDGYSTRDIFQVDGAIFIRKTAKRIEADLNVAEQKIKASPAIKSVRRIAAQEIQQKCPIINSDYDGIWVEGGGRVDGRKLVYTLQTAAQAKGCQIVREQAHLISNDTEGTQIQTLHDKRTYDHVLLSVGAWLPQVLNPLGYEVDIHPQKGQLFTLSNLEWQDKHWPVVIPFGQGDIIPFNNGEITIGATHEDTQGFDLNLDLDPLIELKKEAQTWMPSLSNYSIQDVRVGTRAHTSDFSVIAGQVPNSHQLWAISGLGSSGLTSGPYLGYQWSQAILEGKWSLNKEDYPIHKYIHKT